MKSRQKYCVLCFEDENLFSLVKKKKKKTLKIWWFYCIQWYFIALPNEQILGLYYNAVQKHHAYAVELNFFLYFLTICLSHFRCLILFFISLCIVFLQFEKQ